MAHSSRPGGPIANKGLELLTFGTPNGFKVSILLEELKETYGLEYTSQSVDIFQNVQKEPWFLKLNPNGRIPVLIDHDKGGIAIMETLAIMNYLIRHYDLSHKFSFTDDLDISTAEQWLAWQQGGLGPIQAQANFFYRFSPVRYAFPTQRFIGETERLYEVLDSRLSDREYLAGARNGKYSLVDMAVWPFIDASAVTGIKLEQFPHLHQWWDRISRRPGVRQGTMVPSGLEFPYGYRALQIQAKENPEQMEEREKRLQDALQGARLAFGHKSTSP